MYERDDYCSMKGSVITNFSQSLGSVMMSPRAVLNTPKRRASGGRSSRSRIVVKPARAARYGTCVVGSAMAMQDGSSRRHGTSRHVSVQG